MIALVMSTLVVVLCAGLISLTQRATAGQGHASDAKEAFHVAEAGLAEAFSGLTLARSGNVGSPELPARFGDGLFWVTSQAVSGGMVELESIGMVGSGRATLQLHVRRAEAQVGSLGIFSLDDFTLPPFSFVDGYDSRISSYETQRDRGATLGMGRVGSNGDIKLKSGNIGNPTEVDGNVLSGPRAQVDIDSNALITGEVDERSSEVQLPQLVLPDGEPAAPDEVHWGSGDKDQVLAGGGLDSTQGALDQALYYDHDRAFYLDRNLDLELRDGVPYIVPPGDQAFGSLALGDGSELVLTGPSTVTVQNVHAEGGSRLLMDTTNGHVDLIVTESMVFEDDSSLESSAQDPLEASLLFAGDGRFELNANSKFHGSIIAPEASVTVGEDFELFGALAAKKLEFEDGVQLHFDHALSDPNLDGANRPRVISWRVVDIPLEINQRSKNPFGMLGVVRADLPLPSAAHEDQMLSVSYTDGSGNPATYDGPEKDFDWGDVSDVDSATRDGSAVTPVEDIKYQAPSSILEAPVLGDDAPWDEAVESLYEYTLRISPLGPALLSVALDEPEFNSNHITRIMLAQGSVGVENLNKYAGRENMQSKDMTSVLLANSPLDASTLALVVGSIPDLKVGHRAKIIKAQ